MDQSSVLVNTPVGISPAIVGTNRGRDIRYDRLDETALQQAIAMSESQPPSDSLGETYSPCPAYSSTSNLGWFPWKSLPPPSWLRDEREVHILKHYIDVLSTWVCLCLISSRVR